MPNLFSRRPVVIFAWVAASTSGLTRSAIVASRPEAAASSASATSSGSLSTLNWKMPVSSPKRSSSRVLPTPENTMRPGGMPAASARFSSPADTTSAPAPRRARVAITPWLELAFSA